MFKLIIGPMFAGKSTMLYEEVLKRKEMNENFIVVCHQTDDRYGKGLNTHDNKNYRDVICVSSFRELLQGYRLKVLSSRLIFIDELQFFPDAYYYITNLVNTFKINVIAAGLSGDYQMKPIGDITKLIPFADETIILKANCMICNSPAPFSKRICDSNEVILAGGVDRYIPVCRYHYDKPITFLFNSLEKLQEDKLLLEATSS